ncbi:MAG: hypothetical protein WBW38_20660 [Candidatus Sulfotelmatobacter sp.]
MPSSAALRLQIERAVEHRFPSALTSVARTIREVAATGVAEVDELLDGGLPVGAISEFTGPESSGRTSLALAFVAQRTAIDQMCAWVDVVDAFDPESAAANGVALQRLLWVRCSNPDRQAKTKPWSRLDQALRATDLLLQMGGFAAIVLDLGDTAQGHGNRIPLASWFRFRQAADSSRCCLIVLGKAGYAQSSAAVVLECSPARAQTAGGTLLRGFEYNVRRGRERFVQFSADARKPPGSTWSASAAWKSDRRA